MSQVSQITIDNVAFGTFRSNLNDTLSALNTTQSGTSRPSSAVAGTIWLDTTTAASPTLKYYDGSDDISLATLDHSANTVNWLDSAVSVAGLTTTATGTVLTLQDTNIEVSGGSTQGGEIRFKEDSDTGSNYTALKAGNPTSNVTFTLPIADGTSGQAITTDGSGNLSFADSGGGSAADDITAGDSAVSLSTTSGNITIENDASDGDIIFKVNDGGVDKTVFTIDGSDNGKLIFQDDVAAISLDKLIGKFDTDTGIDFGVTVGGGDASSADPSNVISFTTGGDEMMRLVTERQNYTTLAVGDTSNLTYHGYVFAHGHEATQNGGSQIVIFRHEGTSPYGMQIHFSGQSPDNNTQHFINCRDQSSDRFRVESDGDVQNHDNSYGSISDERIKDNIADASSQWDDIKALKVRKFKMKDDILQYGAENATYKLGLIAQETEAVCPNLIKKRKASVEEVKHSSEFGTVVDDTDAPIVDKHQNPVLDDDGNPTYQKKVVPKEGDAALVRQMKYSVLYMKAIKCLQEAQTRIETLESKVKTLEGA
jgi:hypothetical protein